LRGWHLSGYDLVPIPMIRSTLSLGILCLCLAAAHGRATEEKKPGEAAAVKPKRVLFRTDSPRLFAPQAGEPAKSPRAPVVKSVPPTAAPRVVRVTSSKQARAASAPLPTPKRSETQVVVPPLPQPELRPRATVTTPLREDPRGSSRFNIDFLPTSFTPYDRYMGTVKTVISQLDERDASMVTACELVLECRRFRYTMTDLYRADPPAVTEARRAGDCKSKALWVYDHLGDPRAYYVIGKLERRARTSHAWVYWRNNGRWWILDPTVRSAPIAADSVSSGRYVPYYSFSRSGAFRHSATRLMVAAHGIPAVSAKAPVRTQFEDLRAGEGGAKKQDR